MYLFSACLEQNSDNQRLRFAIMQKMRFVKRRKNTATCEIIREDDWGGEDDALFDATSEVRVKSKNSKKISTCLLV